MVMLARAAVYGTLFVVLVLITLPGRVLAWSGIVRPTAPGPLAVAGIAVGLAGGALAVWCVVSFALIGKGTPAPFDPPRRLVVAGPYRYVRNPMYLGAGTALLGATLYYRSLALLGYAVLFFGATHLFVVWYEEPTLERRFGAGYQAYRASVRRWLPRRTPLGNHGAPPEEG